MPAEEVSRAVSARSSWEDQQTHAFLSWINSKGSLDVTELNQLTDGLALIRLIEKLSGKTLGRFVKDPKMRCHKLENMNVVMKALSEQEVRLVNIGVEDVVDCKKKLMLGLLWSIILKYQLEGALSEGAKTVKAGLLCWAQRLTAEYSEVNIVNFCESFQDGKALCAMIHKMFPDSIDLEVAFKMDPASTIQMALDTAERVMGVPKLLDAACTAACPEELSVMTQVSEFFQKISKIQDQRNAEKVIANHIQRKICELKRVDDFIEQSNQAKALIQAMSGSSQSKELLTQELLSFTPEEAVNRLATDLEGLEVAVIETMPKIHQSLQSSEEAWASMQGDAVPSVVAEAAALPSQYANIMEQKIAVASDLQSLLRTQITLKCSTQMVDSLLEQTSLWATRNTAVLAKAEQLLSQDSSKALIGDFKEQSATHTDMLSRADAIIGSLKNKGASEACVQDLGAALSRATNAMNLALESATRLEANLQLKDSVNAVGCEYRLKTNNLYSDLHTIEAAMAGCVIPPTQLYNECECTAETVRAEELKLSQQVTSDNLSSIYKKSSECQALSKQLIELGSSPDLYSTHTAADLESQCVRVEAELVEKQQAFINTIQAFEQVAALMETYKQQVHAFEVWRVACDSLALKHAAALHAAQADKDGELPQLAAGFKHQLKDSVCQGQAIVSNVQSTARKVHQLAPGLMLAMKNLDHPSKVLSMFHTSVHKLHEQEHATDFAYDIHIKKSEGFLSDDQLQEITDTFKAFDTDHDGKLSSTELRACLNALGQDVDENVIFEMIQEASHTEYMKETNGIAVDKLIGTIHPCAKRGANRYTCEQLVSFLSKRVIFGGSCGPKAVDLVHALKSLSDHEGQVTESFLREKSSIDSVCINWVMDHFGKSIRTTTQETDLATITVTERCLDIEAFLASNPPPSNTAGEDEENYSLPTGPNSIPANSCMITA